MNCKAALKHSKIASNCQHDGTPKEPKRRRAEKTASRKDGNCQKDGTSYRAEKTAGRQDGDCQHDGTSCQAESTAIRKDGSRQRKKGMTDYKIHAKGAVGLKQEQK